MATPILEETLDAMLATERMTAWVPGRGANQPARVAAVIPASLTGLAADRGGRGSGRSKSVAACGSIEAPASGSCAS